jgi:hypothetical protein
MGGSTDRKRKINLGGDVDDNITARNGGKHHHQDTLHARQSSEVNPWTGRTYSQRYKSILQTRLQLPVYQFQSQLLEAVSSNQTVVVEGETGSGKTTQIPQFLVEVRGLREDDERRPPWRDAIVPSHPRPLSFQNLRVKITSCVPPPRVTLTHRISLYLPPLPPPCRKCITKKNKKKLLRNIQGRICHSRKILRGMHPAPSCRRHEHRRPCRRGDGRDARVHRGIYVSFIFARRWSSYLPIAAFNVSCSKILFSRREFERIVAPHPPPLPAAPFRAT